MSIPEPLLTAREAAAILRRGRSFMTLHAAALGAIKVGNRLMFTQRGLDQYIEAQRVKAPTREPVPVAPKRRLSVVSTTSTLDPATLRPRKEASR